MVDIEKLQWRLFPSKLSAKGRLCSILYNSRCREVVCNRYASKHLENTDSVDIAVISRNNSSAIQRQILLLNRFLTDKFNYIVFDNSTDERASAEINAICDEESVGYVRLKQSMARTGSENHAVALNYVYWHWLSKRNARYIALLDHDIFLVKQYSIIDKLQSKPLFGYLKQEETGIRYLWPGLSFFRGAYLQGKHIDFMTYWAKRGDTGSSNYFALYRDLDDSECGQFAAFQRYEILDSCRGGLSNPQGDMISLMDNAWLHMLNGSKWNSSATNYDTKELIVFNYLDNLCKIEQ